MGWRTRRGDYFPLLVLLIVSQGLRFEGGLLPLHLGGSPGSTFAPLLLFLRVLPLIFSTISCPPHHILEQGNPPRITAQASKALQYQHRRHQKKKRRGQKLG
jgi:hypothetical protein